MEKYTGLTVGYGYAVGEIFLLLLAFISSGFLQFFFVLFGLAYALLAIASPFMVWSEQ